MYRVVFFWALLCATVLSAAGDSSAVAVKASPAFSFEPASVEIRIRIEPHPDNREACLVYDSDVGQAGASCWQIDGQTAPSSRRLLRDLTAGEYEATVRVARAGGGVVSGRVGFRVLGRGLEP